MLGRDPHCGRDVARWRARGVGDGERGGGKTGLADMTAVWSTSCVGWEVCGLRGWHCANRKRGADHASDGAGAWC